MITREASDLGMIPALRPAAGVAHSKYACLIARTKEIAAPITLVVHPCDKTSLRGAAEAAEAGIIVSILVGPAAKILAVARGCGIDVTRYKIAGVPRSDAAAAKAAEPIGGGELLMAAVLYAHARRSISPLPRA